MFSNQKAYEATTNNIFDTPKIKQLQNNLDTNKNAINELSKKMQKFYKEQNPLKQQLDYLYSITSSDESKKKLRFEIDVISGKISEVESQQKPLLKANEKIQKQIDSEQNKILKIHWQKFDEKYSSMIKVFESVNKEFRELHNLKTGINIATNCDPIRFVPDLANWFEYSKPEYELNR